MVVTKHTWSRELVDYTRNWSRPYFICSTYFTNCYNYQKKEKETADNMKLI